MNDLIKLISDFNPILIINGKEYNNLNDYTDKADYTNNSFHCYYYDKKTNVCDINFISEYALSKITGSCGC
jgi:anaerobic ribonucleoside-triphosphate reductase